MYETTREDRWVRRLAVTTPEQVELRFETAGIGSRIGAQLIDTLVLLAVNVAILLAGLLIVESFPGALAEWLTEYAWAAGLLIYASLNGGYFLIGEYATGGRTIGKRAMGLRVIQDNGRPLSFLASAVRNLLRVIDALPTLYVVGALCSFFHPHDKRLGDLAAGTVVVYDAGGAKRREKRMRKQLDKWAPHLPAIAPEPWMRERVSEGEWELLSGFAERLPYLAPRRAEELAAGIVAHLAPKLGLEERWAEASADARHAAFASERPQAAPAGGEPPPEPEQAPPAPPLSPAAPGRERSAAVAWALAMYAALRADWEYGGGTDGGAQ